MPSVIALICERCGAQLSHTVGNRFIECLFCGSEHLIEREVTDRGESLSEPDEFDLADFFSSADASTFSPSIAVSEAFEIIAKAISAQESGLKNPGSLAATVEGCYFPAWRIRANVAASWCGQYSEKRSVTKWKKMTKSVGNGRIETFNEPYTDTETIWHPINGNETFTTKFLVPAAQGFSKQQLAVCAAVGAGVGDWAGSPVADDAFAVAEPSKTESDAWIEFRCDELVDVEATDRCQKCAERVDSVSSSVISKEVGLVFYPVAVVSYSANDQEYRHFVNLITGGFSGDLPLDEKSIRKEMKAAAGAQMTLNNIRTVALSAALVLSSFVAMRLCFGNDGFDLSMTWLCGVALAFFVALLVTRNHSPWRHFIWKRRGHLLRMFASPPGDLKAAIERVKGIEELREVVAKRSAANSLEAIGGNAAGLLGVQVATVLRSIKPGLNPYWHWSLKFLLPGTLTVLAGFVEMKRLESESRAVALATSNLQNDSPERDRPATPQRVFSAEAGTGGSPHENREKGPEFPGADAVQEARAESREGGPEPTASVLTTPPNDDLEMASPEKSNRETTQTPDSKATSGDAAERNAERLIQAKEKLAAVEAQIASEKIRWNEAVTTINRLTNNKRIAVQEGTQAYYRCVEASRVVKEVETGAAGLKARKSEIESEIQTLYSK